MPRRTLNTPHSSGIAKTILDLPLELLYAVFEEEDIKNNDLKSLRLAHKHFAIALLPILFKTVSLTFEDDPIWDPVEYNDAGPRDDETQVMYTERMIAKWTTRLTVEKDHTPVKERIAALSKKKKTSMEFRSTPRTFILDLSQPATRIDDYATYFCRRGNLIGDIKTWFPNIKKIVLKVNFEGNLKGNSKLMKKFVAAVFKEDQGDDIELALDIFGLQAVYKFPKGIRNCSELTFSGESWTLGQLSRGINASLTASPGVSSLKILDPNIVSDESPHLYRYLNRSAIDLKDLFKRMEIDALGNLRSLSLGVKASCSDAAVLQKLPVLQELIAYNYTTDKDSNRHWSNSLPFRPFWANLQTAGVYLTKIAVKMIDRTLLTYLHSYGRTITDLSIVALICEYNRYNREEECSKINKTFWRNTLPQLAALERLVATSKCKQHYYSNKFGDNKLTLQIPTNVNNLAVSLSKLKEITIGVFQQSKSPHRTVNLERLIQHLAESCMNARYITIELMCDDGIPTTDSQAISWFERKMSRVICETVEESSYNSDAFAEGTAVYVKIFLSENRTWKHSHSTLKFITRGGKFEKAI